MKKSITFILLLCMVLSLAACGKVDITMQEVYDASLTEAVFKNHESAYVRDEMDGEFYGEKYLTKEYVYDYIYDAEYEWSEFTTDDANYYYLNGDYVRFLTITPDGVSSDFASYRAKYYASVALDSDTVDETIESVSKKDGRITVTSSMSQKTIEDMAEYGVTGGKFEYVLDVKTREIVALSGDYTYDDGTDYHMSTEVSYDTDAPERVKEFLKYENETENLRTITFVNHPGTEQEACQSVQMAKGLVVGFRYEGDDYVFEVYADAACTEPYDPYVDTESDQTVYIVWKEQPINTNVDTQKVGSESAEQDTAMAVTVYPRPDTTMENLTDATLSISLNEGDAYVDDTGKMQMKVRIYTYDLYDAIDITQLQAGDIIVRHAEEVAITSVERGENGYLCINGGLENGGFDLATDGGGIFYEIGFNDTKNWYEVGEATIRVSADFMGYDRTDPEQGEVVIYPGDFLVGAVTDYNFTPYNTTIRIEAGQIVELIRNYVP